MNSSAAHPFLRRAAPVLLITVITAGFAWAYRQLRDWGASPEDLARELPGDALVPEAEFVRTRAIIIEATRDEVWRCLLRPGGPCGDWADGVGPGPLDRAALSIAAIDPPNALVLQQCDPARPWDVSWAFAVGAGPGSASRLLVRTRARSRPGQPGRLSFALFRLQDPITLSAVRRMLFDVKYRAEAAALDRVPR